MVLKLTNVFELFDQFQYDGTFKTIIIAEGGMFYNTFTLGGKN